MGGKSVTNPDPVIRLFSLCEGMKWSHLPVAGGIYDQHPDLIEKFSILFQIRAKLEAMQAEEDRRKANVKSRGVSGASRSR